MAMNEEINRLKSFEGYKSVALPSFNPSRYAKVGFYATGRGEEIKCFFCTRTIFRLLTTDPEPVQLHLRTNSSCPLIRRRNTTNVEHPPFELTTILPPPFNDEHGIGVRTKYPEFVFFERRLQSYRNWPRENPTATDLANAGFFALGESDKVACFSCGLGLMEFDDTDIAFEEHARWGPKCDFLTQNKGADYIKAIQEKYNATT
jgi:hypothetical protein